MVIGFTIQITSIQKKKRKQKKESYHAENIDERKQDDGAEAPKV
jgi:hypothetical protein